MYLSRIKLWNFRKYGPSNNFESNANLDLNFEKGLNVLIGANDSGKTAILDAIKLVLRPNTGEWIRIDIEEDFYKNKKNLKIELEFLGLKDSEARHFTEFLIIEDGKEKLILSCEISHNGNKIFHYDVKAGRNGELGILSAEQRDLLNITYLKPLRDVKTEFIPKKNSRLSTILQAHKAFDGQQKSHILMDIFKNFDNSIENYFKGLDADGNKLSDLNGEKLKNEIDTYIKSFLDLEKEGKFSVSKGTLKNILERLELTIKETINPGLGSLNRLFIASELLHLEKENDGLRLGLIEEIEAHIHPQAQMKVIETLQDKSENSDIQIILTTHSPNLASKVKIKNLIICHNNDAFPMGSEYTNLKEEDYRFMERFIDVTKSNLFFSEGVIFVEGWAEEIFLPTLAKLLKNLGILTGGDLTEQQVSVVNIGHNSFGRYKKIFERKDKKKMNKKIAIVTDIDLMPGATEIDIKNKINKKEKDLSNPHFNIQGFISPHWTLEYCLGLFEPFQKYLYHAILLTFQEQKDYSDNKNITKLQDFINNFELNPESELGKLGKTNEKIAFKLYHMILGDEEIAGLSKLKLSKTIVAQYFSDLMEENFNNFQKEDFEKESSIYYLTNAIKYACNEEK